MNENSKMVWTFIDAKINENLNYDEKQEDKTVVKFQNVSQKIMNLNSNTNLKRFRR